MKEKNVHVLPFLSFLFLLLLDLLQKINQREKVGLFLDTMASKSAQLFSSKHPFLSLNVCGEHSQQRASACSSFSKPRATISVYSCGKALAFPINSLDKNVAQALLFFSELMDLFQEAGS